MPDETSAATRREPRGHAADPPRPSLPGLVGRTVRRVALRLTAIALIPAVGLSVFAVTDIVDRSSAVRLAEDVEQQVELLADVVELRFLISKELVPTMATAVAPGYDLTVEQVELVLGVELSERVAESRLGVDAMLAQRPEEPTFRTVATQLAVIRQEHDEGRIDAAATYATFVGALALLDERVTAETNITLESLRDGDSVAPLREAVEQLLIVHRASQPGTWLLPELVAVSAPALQIDLGDPTMALARDAAVFEYITSRFDSKLTGATAAAWRAYQRDPQVRRFELAVDAALGGDPPDLLTSSTEAAAMIQAGISRLDAMYVLHVAADSDVRSAGVELRATALRAVTTSALFLVAVFALSVVMVGFVGRSITRPLQRLARYAAAVSAGDVHAHRPPGRSGPMEVQTVTAAFDDVVANLRAIDAHAGALAGGHLDDPVFARPLPGPLGERLHASVARLANSIGEREELHRRLSHEANHDSLTELPNRAAAMVGLEAAISRTRRRGTSLAVLFIDLDEFKRANDTYGHDVGDEVLRRTADRIRGITRAEDTIARLGGDEFLLIAEDLADIHHAVEIGERVIEVVSAPIDLDGRIVRLGASVGISMAVDGMVDGDDLVREADLAVYRAKEAGKGRVEIFDHAMRTEVAHRTRIETTLETAIARDELTVALQPVLDVAGDRVTGFEALVRWDDVDGRPISPELFVPIAERSDLVLALDCWVMRHAAATLASWDPELTRGIHLAVNLSGRHLLDRRVVQDVSRTVRESGWPAEQLVVEITETVLLSDMPVACGHLEQLRELGVMVSLDDFGSGYTSLATLRRLPVDILKIDRSLIADLQEHRGTSLVRLIIEAAHEFGLGVVAEGVETEAQRVLLAELGCEQVQGWLFSPAVEARAAHDFLRADHGRH